MSWGWNEHGMCGSGDEVNVNTPASVVGLTDDHHFAILVGCGAGHTFAIVDHR